MYILKKIKKDIISAVNSALETDNLKISDLTTPPDPKLGDLSLATFGLAKRLKKDPLKSGEFLKEKLDTFKSELSSVISKIDLAGPYLNFVINKEFLANEVLEEITGQKNGYGENRNLKGKKIMVEFAQPNPFKAFHIGHLRNTLLGESVCQLLESSGAKVIRANYQGDVGMHIAKCLWAFQKIDPNEYPKLSDKKVALITQCYAQGAKAFEEDKKTQEEIKVINKEIYTREDKKVNQLWELGKKWSLDKFAEIFDRLDVSFDRQFMESEVMNLGLKKTQEALKKKILEKNNGAVIFKGDKYDLDTRVFINSRNLPTYEGKELGLAYKKFEEYGLIDLHIHVVAEEQISFFKVTFKVKELLDPEKFAGKQLHYSYGFVGLKKGKMSSRKGEVVLAQDIFDETIRRIKKIAREKDVINDENEAIEKIGLGSIKYAFLKIDPKKYLAFDIDTSVNFEGDSGPYLQYTYARIQSILRKAGFKKSFRVLGIGISLSKSAAFLTESLEHQLILQLAKYPGVITKSTKKYDPSEVAKYLFDLSQIFNDYYHAVPILKAEKGIKKARLLLITSVAQTIKNGLKILGIETLDKM